MSATILNFDRGVSHVVGGVLLIVIVILLSMVTTAMIFEMVETPEEMPVTRGDYEWKMDKGKFVLQQSEQFTASD